MSASAQFAEYLEASYSACRVPVVDLQMAQQSDLGAALPGAFPAIVRGPDAGLDDRLRRCGLPLAFAGWTRAARRITVLDPHVHPPVPAPLGYRVVAIVPTFNEADIIRGTLEYLTRDGVAVHVVDNWSTDGTLELVDQWAATGLVTSERFPKEGAPSTYDLRGIMSRVEELSATLAADWIVLHDADERRRGPWPTRSLRDSLYAVDRAGFNCVDHVTLNFWPTDNGYQVHDELESYFRYFEFSAHPGHFHQRRAWKTGGRPVSLSPTAGHDVQFADRRVFPYKFLLKHYPIRSEQHGRRKVLRERRQRWNQAERQLGWHRQYDAISQFLRRPEELLRFDDATFYEQWLIERLSGIGIFEAPPAWATGPKWTHAAA